MDLNESSEYIVRSLEWLVVNSELDTLNFERKEVTLCYGSWMAPEGEKLGSSKFKA